MKTSDPPKLTPLCSESAAEQPVSVAHVHVTLWRSGAVALWRGRPDPLQAETIYPAVNQPPGQARLLLLRQQCIRTLVSVPPPMTMTPPTAIGSVAAEIFLSPHAIY